MADRIHLKMHGEVAYLRLEVNGYVERVEKVNVPAGHDWDSKHGHDHLAIEAWRLANDYFGSPRKITWENGPWQPRAWKVEEL